MADSIYSKRSSLKGGNSWQKDFSPLAPSFQPNKKSFFSERHSEMFDFKPPSKKKDIARSLYDALGIKLSRNLDLEVLKSGKFSIPIGKKGLLSGGYRHRGGSRHLSNYDMKLSASFPVNLKGILY
ncbi:hypothetical protein HN682_05555 [Candidatus Peregrinibacteria bacterium]|jgi:hypothetical protein|nr:hypothetical protein [Candidatus Peregrinibacteria bacterium]